MWFADSPCRMSLSLIDSFMKQQARRQVVARGRFCVQEQHAVSSPVSEGAESPWEQLVTESRAEPRGWKQDFILSLHRQQSRTIYRNGTNEGCSCVGSPRRSLILPGGVVKHRGWPPQPSLWKENLIFLSFFWKVWFCLHSCAAILIKQEKMSAWGEKPSVDVEKLRLLFICCRDGKNRHFFLLILFFSACSGKTHMPFKPPTRLVSSLMRSIYIER